LAILTVPEHTIMSTSRGEDVRNYIPSLSKGAKIPLACFSAGITTGVTSAAITSGLIKNGNIQEAKLVSACVTSGKIKNGNVTSVKLAAASVISAKIGAAAVKAANLAASIVTSAKMGAAFLSGTLVSGQITKAVAHGLGAKPKCVVVAPLLTAAQAISATYLHVVLAAASAATTTNFYIIGNQPTNGAIKYVAYVQL
jgi:hypothetical protein